MKNKYNITVTEEHIKQGQANFDSGSPAQSCPLALAIKEQVGVKRATVGIGGRAILTGRFFMNDYVLPLEARQFVRDFDRGNTVKPIKFTIYKEH